MIDIVRQNKKDDTPASAAQTLAPETQAAPTANATPLKMPSHMSRGEKLYTWGLYEGMNYWLNLGSSLVIADYFCNLSGKDLIKKGATKLATSLAKSPAAHDKIFHNAQTALKTLSLLSGGWLLIIPTKIIEDHQRPIVHWLNKQLGVDQTGADGKQLTSDQIYIEKEQPHQSWLNVLGRRLLATGLVMGTGHTINAVFRDREKTKTYIGTDDPHGGKAVVERYVIGKVNKVMSSGYVPGGQAFVNSATAQRYLGLAALDTAFTKITSTTIKLTNGAKKARMPNEIGDDDAPIASDKSVDQIKYLDEKKPASYVERREAEKQEAKADIKDPESFRKKPIVKKENFVSAAADKTNPTLSPLG